MRTKKLVTTFLLALILACPVTVQGRQVAKDVESASLSEDSRQVVYSGVVYDSDGMPLVGAGVSRKSAPTEGTVTDADGRWSFSAKAGEVFVVSYLGFVDQEIVLGENQYITVYLSEDAQLLEDVVVIGYGTASKKLVSSSIASVKMDDINRGAELDPMKMLQGRVTGVSITSGSGSPGEHLM